MDTKNIGWQKAQRVARMMAGADRVRGMTTGKEWEKRIMYGWRAKIELITPMSENAEHAFHIYAPAGVSFASMKINFPGPTPEGLMTVSYTHLGASGFRHRLQEPPEASVSGDYRQCGQDHHQGDGCGRLKRRFYCL